MRTLGNSVFSSRIAARTGTSLPPWPLSKNTFRAPKFTIERHSSMINWIYGIWLTLNVPAKNKWWVECPGQSVGKQRTLAGRSRSTPRATAVTRSVSVVRGKCGPCCSKEPSGNTVTLLASLNFFTSGQVRFSRSIVRAAWAKKQCVATKEQWALCGWVHLQCTGWGRARHSVRVVGIPAYSPSLKRFFSIAARTE